MPAAFSAEEAIAKMTDSVMKIRKELRTLRRLYAFMFPGKPVPDSDTLLREAYDFLVNKLGEPNA